MRNLLILLVLVLLAFSPAVFAVRVHSIYQAQIPVPSQSSPVRFQAAKAGLAQVLVKVSGDSLILESKPELKASLDRAGSWIQEYSYSVLPHVTKSMPYLLTMRFDAEAVNKLLLESGSPIWGQNRPLILVWLVVDGLNHSGDIVDSDSGGEVQTILKQY